MSCSSDRKTGSSRIADPMTGNNPVELPSRDCLRISSHRSVRHFVRQMTRLSDSLTPYPHQVTIRSSCGSCSKGSFLSNLGLASSLPWSTTSQRGINMRSEYSHLIIPTCSLAGRLKSRSATTSVFESLWQNATSLFLNPEK